MRRYSTILAISCLIALLAGCTATPVHWPEDEKSALQSEIAAFSSQYATLSAEFEDSQSALLAARNELELANVKNTDLKSERDSLEKQLLEVSVQTDLLERQLKELAAQLAALTQSDTVLERANTVVKILKEQGFAALRPFIHADKGLLFSPYGYIQNDAQVFNIDELLELPGSDKVYSWGKYTGSGDPIELTFSEYYSKFIYDADFANARKIGNNVIIGRGNSLHNISDVFPESVFVEFHFTGFEEQFGGLDRVSLRLVFMQSDGAWYLTAIVHDSWTS